MLKDKIEVYEINAKVFVRRNLWLDEVPERLAKLIDSALMAETNLAEVHRANAAKFYTFNYLWPVEKNQIYREGQIYNFQIRTVDMRLVKNFTQILCDQISEDFKVLVTTNKLIPQKVIDKIYSITPVILRHKEKQGYWKTQMALNEYEQMLKQNIMKKYHTFKGERGDEDFPLYTTIRVLNEKPCKLNLKGITLLGDKLELTIAGNPKAQELAYFLTGTGMGEICSRGAGFMNFKWMQGGR